MSGHGRPRGRLRRNAVPFAIVALWVLPAVAILAGWVHVP